MRLRKAKPEILDLHIVTDEDLAGLGPETARELFARSEAAGAGDFDLTAADYRGSDKGAILVGFDEDTVIPQWPQAQLARVAMHIKGITPADVSALSVGLTGSLEKRAAEMDALRERLFAGLAELQSPGK